MFPKMFPYLAVIQREKWNPAKLVPTVRSKKIMTSI